MLGIEIQYCFWSSHEITIPKVAWLKCPQDDNTCRHVGISSLASFGWTHAIQEIFQSPVERISFDIPMYMRSLAKAVSGFKHAHHPNSHILYLNCSNRTSRRPTIHYQVLADRTDRALAECSEATSKLDKPPWDSRASNNPQKLIHKLVSGFT